MGNDLNRADFLRGRFRPKIKERVPSYLALPDAVPHPLFETLCDGCGDCISQCPSNIITLSPLSFDQDSEEMIACLNFTGQTEGCTFCKKCTQACPTGALDPDQSRPWHLKADLNVVSCLSLNGIVCRTCGDVCDVRAIKFRLMTGGRAYPEIKLEDCTGCGTCVALCPVQAMTLQENTIEIQTPLQKEAMT